MVRQPKSSLTPKKKMSIGKIILISFGSLFAVIAIAVGVFALLPKNEAIDVKQAEADAAQPDSTASLLDLENYSSELVTGQTFDLNPRKLVATYSTKSGSDAKGQEVTIYGSDDQTMTISPDGTYSASGTAQIAADQLAAGLVLPFPYTLSDTMTINGSDITLDNKAKIDVDGGDMTGGKFKITPLSTVKSADDGSKIITIIGKTDEDKVYKLATYTLTADDLETLTGIENKSDSNSDKVAKLLNLEVKEQKVAGGIDFKSSDEKVAEVTQAGKVKALNAGAAKITAKAANEELEACVVVKDVNAEKDSLRKDVIAQKDAMKLVLKVDGTYMLGGFFSTSRDEGICSYTKAGTYEVKDGKELAFDGGDAKQKIEVTSPSGKKGELTSQLSATVKNGIAQFKVEAVNDSNGTIYSFGKVNLTKEQSESLGLAQVELKAPSAKTPASAQASVETGGGRTQPETHEEGTYEVTRSSASVIGARGTLVFYSDHTFTIDGSFDLYGLTFPFFSTGSCTWKCVGGNLTFGSGALMDAGKITDQYGLQKLMTIIRPSGDGCDVVIGYYNSQGGDAPEIITVHLTKHQLELLETLGKDTTPHPTPTPTPTPTPDPEPGPGPTPPTPDPEPDPDPQGVIITKELTYQKGAITLNVKGDGTFEVTAKDVVVGNMMGMLDITVEYTYDNAIKYANGSLKMDALNAFPTIKYLLGNLDGKPDLSFFTLNDDGTAKITLKADSQNTAVGDNGVVTCAEFDLSAEEVAKLKDALAPKPLITKSDVDYQKGKISLKVFDDGTFEVTAKDVVVGNMMGMMDITVEYTYDNAFKFADGNLKLDALEKFPKTKYLLGELTDMPDLSFLTLNDDGTAKLTLKADSKNGAVGDSGVVTCAEFDLSAEEVAKLKDALAPKPLITKSDVDYQKGKISLKVFDDGTFEVTAKDVVVGNMAGMLDITVEYTYDNAIKYANGSLKMDALNAFPTIKYLLGNLDGKPDLSFFTLNDDGTAKITLKADSQNTAVGDSGVVTCAEFDLSADEVAKIKAALGAANALPSRVAVTKTGKDDDTTDGIGAHTSINKAVALAEEHPSAHSEQDVIEVPLEEPAQEIPSEEVAEDTIVDNDSTSEEIVEPDETATNDDIAEDAVEEGEEVEEAPAYVPKHMAPTAVN